MRSIRRVRWWIWTAMWLGWLGALPPAAEAAAVYEPFDYTVGQSLALASGNEPQSLPDTPYDWNAGAGFQAGTEWGLGRSGTGCTSAAAIVPGLQLAGLETAGGAVRFTHSGGDFGTIARAVGVNVGSGELWASYLYQAGSVGTGSVADVRFRNAAAGAFCSGNRKFRNAGDSAADSLYGGVGAGDTIATADGPSLGDGRTYLLVAKYTNLGQTGTAKWWALAQRDFDKVRFDGIITETELNAANIDSLTQSGQTSQTLASGDWLQVTVYQGNATFDELRFGSSAADVLPATTVAWRRLYEEKFPDSSGDNLAMSAAGWSVYAGSGATDYSSTVLGAGTRTGISYFNGSPDGEPGFGFAVPSVPSGEVPALLAFTEEFAPIDPAGLSELKFSWRQHASANGAQYRLALEIDGNWYAIDVPFINTGDGQTGSGDQFTSEGVLRTVNFSLIGSLWRDLAFVPGSALSLAGSARTIDLPEGLITGAGLFLSAANDVSMRFDTFRIEGIFVPEPATLALFAVGGLALAAFGRRRRPRAGKRSLLILALAMHPFRSPGIYAWERGSPDSPSSPICRR